MGDKFVLPREEMVNTAPRQELKMPDRAEIYMDRDVAMVLKFMVMNIRSDKCIPVAKAVYQLAEPMFRRYIEQSAADDPGLFIPLGLRPGHPPADGDRLER